MKAVSTFLGLCATYFAFSQQPQLIESIGAAQLVFSCQGAVSQGFKLTNGANQTGVAMLHDPRNLNEGLIAPFSVHFGQRTATNKMVFLLSPEKFTNVQLDTYLQAPSSRYVGVQIETNPLGSSKPDALSLLLKNDTINTTVGPVSADINGADIEFDPVSGEMPEYHNLSIIYDIRNHYFTVSFDGRVRLQYCADLVKAVFNGDNRVFIGMAGATYGQPDSQQVCLGSSNFAFSCCPDNPGCRPANFERGWYSIGLPENGLWKTTGNKVIQAEQRGPSIFMLPVPLLNVKMMFKAQINRNGNTNLMRNNWGFVLGMPHPGCDTTQHRYWLFDWRGEPGSTCNGQHTATPGYSLSKVDGANIPTGCALGETADYFWSHRDDNQVFDLKKPATGSPGWQFDSTYEFEVVYAFDRIEVKINGTLVLQYTDKACFESGSFGFFTYEQQNVEFSDFTYQHLVYFSMDTGKGTSACTKQFIRFNCYNTCHKGVNSAQITGLEWKFGDGSSTGFLSGSERAFSVDYAFQKPGVYEVIMTATDENGCRGEARQQLRINPAPDSLELGTTNASCLGKNDGAVEVLNPLPDLMYSLTGNDYFGNTIFTGIDIGYHTLYIQNTNFCTLKMPFFIDAPQAVTAQLHAQDTIFLGDTAKITAIVQSNGIPIKTYNWSTGSVCSFCRIIFDQPLSTTTYTLTVTNTLGCSATTQKTIVVADAMRLYIPNSFSPNGDGYNDYFTVFGGPEIKIISYFHVFNRWGNLVHEARNFLPGDPATAWKGMDQKGCPQLPGVYVGIAEIERIDGKRVRKKFDISLIR